MAGVVALLVAATVAIWALGRLRPAYDVTELTLRVRSWWVMVAVFALALLLSRTVSLVFFGLLSFLALKEYLSLIPVRRADRRVLLVAYLAIPIQYYWIWDRWYGLFIIFIPVYIFLLLPIPMILVGDTKGFLKAVGTLHWGLMATVFGVSHLAYLLVLPESVNPVAGPAALLLYLVFLTEFNDVAQFIWGKLLGRHPVVPTVSPKKTVEGLLGGVATTVALAVVLAPWLTPFGPREAAGLGLVIALAGFFGDVVISAVKRDLAIKDSGSLLPGHGGMLDRIDSLTYTAPLFFHIVRYFHT
ncbi:MAG: phosphatidate cytidylyltransferase [Thermoanaerobaculia bacterium]|nr:phosphatidate cytidylyltransferase [Thermoanaerobaculia bacterium]